MAKKETAKKVRGAVKAPSKTTMNFVHHKSSFNPRRMIPLILVVLLAAAAFVKVGILDQNEKRLEAYRRLGEKQDQLTAIEAMLSGYDELANKYGRYSYGWMTDTEINLVNRIDVLNLIEKKIAPRAVIENFAINSNVLTLNIHGLTLDQASDMVKSIEQSELVESASVYNAVAEEAKEASIFMSIILTKEAE